LTIYFSGLKLFTPLIILPFQTAGVKNGDEITLSTNNPSV